VQAYSPLTKAQKLEDPKLVAIANKYKGMTTAQLLIRWCLQHDVITIPKSITPQRIIENCDHTNVFDTIVSEEDMTALDAFDEYFVTGWDPTKGP
jgi:diketogulonate reductase-like aldo/keto reductase